MPRHLDTFGFVFNVYHLFSDSDNQRLTITWLDYPFITTEYPQVIQALTMGTRDLVDRIIQEAQQDLRP